MNDMNYNSPELPTRMLAAQVSSFGDVKDVVTLHDDITCPPMPTKKGYLLVKIGAVSLSPSDVRIMAGDTDLLQKPPHWPYIPGGDVSGVVVQVGPEETRFRPGDKIVATSSNVPCGGLAQYAVIKTGLAEKMPHTLSFAQGAALGTSAICGMQAVADGDVGRGDRVLVLGGSGGVGCAVIQCAKAAGASYVAATSTDEALCRSLGADCVVNYREETWWENADFQRVPFDVVIDCAEGLKAWRMSREHAIIKPAKRGGRFVAVVVYDWKVEIHTWKEMVSFVGPVVWRTVLNYMNSDTPTYHMLMARTGGSGMRKVVRMVSEGRMRPVLDERGPFSFTESGIQNAFELVKNRAGHGKVVIELMT